MFHYLLLFCIDKINGQRTTAAIFHLLKGKRSAQTIQDANLYRLTNYFGIYRDLNRATFAKEVENLHQKKLISISDNHVGQITCIGIQILQEEKEQYSLSMYKGTKYVSFLELFRQRLQLWIQTYTNIAADQHKFLAVTDDEKAQKWVKGHYRLHKSEADNWLAGVYKELSGFLETVPTFYAQLFVDRLTGYQKVGLTIGQLANKNNVSDHDVRLSLEAIYHQLLQYIEQTKPLYLSDFVPIDHVKINTFITESATKTFKLMEEGYSIKEITRLRRLKESTIHDHIVEIAYADPQFTIANFVGADDVEKISHAIRNVPNNKLSLIKQELQGNYSYFQIRLVLASSSDLRTRRG